MTWRQFVIVTPAWITTTSVVRVAFAAQELECLWVSVLLHAAAFAVVSFVIAPALNDRT